MINNIELNIEFLKVFLALFGARILSSEIQLNKIVGFIYWEDFDDDDENQMFQWELKNNSYSLEYGINLLKYIHEYQLNKTDKILLSELELLKILEDLGTYPDRVQEVLDFIFDSEVLEIDDGILTHSLFFHL